MKEQFSLFKNIKETKNGDVVGITDVIQIITSPVMQRMTDYVREFPEPKIYYERKLLLPNITANGIFIKRDNNSLQEYSGVTCIDIDHIPSNEITQMKDCLRNWPYTYFLFTSPSAEGLKLFIRHDLEDPGLHDNMYAQLVRTFGDEWGCQNVDKHTIDLSRATFLSYDPDFYWNPKALSWHFEYDPNIRKKVRKSNGCMSQTVNRDCPMTTAMIAKNASFQESWADKTLVGYIDKHQWDGFREDYQEGHRNDSILHKAGQLFRCGVHYDVALAKLTHLYSKAFSDMPPEEVESRVHYVYSTAPEEDYGCQRQEWKKKRDDGVAGFLANSA